MIIKVSSAASAAATKNTKSRSGKKVFAFIFVLSFPRSNVVTLNPWRIGASKEPGAHACPLAATAAIAAAARSQALSSGIAVPVAHRHRHAPQRTAAAVLRPLSRLPTPLSLVGVVPFPADEFQELPPELDAQRAINYTVHRRVESDEQVGHMNQLLNRISRRALHEIVHKRQNVADKIHEHDHDEHSSKAQFV